MLFFYSLIQSRCLFISELKGVWLVVNVLNTGFSLISWGFAEQKKVNHIFYAAVKLLIIFVLC
ncbi:MAG TPA: hypothetical protein DIT95_16365 [Arenibacter sp.]|nr:hypothetical protein [Arenibacter sp.]